MSFVLLEYRKNASLNRESAHIFEKRIVHSSETFLSFGKTIDSFARLWYNKR